MRIFGHFSSPLREDGPGPIVPGSVEPHESVATPIPVQHERLCPGTMAKPDGTHDQPQRPQRNDVPKHAAAHAVGRAAKEAGTENAPGATDAGTGPSDATCLVSATYRQRHARNAACPPAGHVPLGPPTGTTGPWLHGRGSRSIHESHGTLSSAWCCSIGHTQNGSVKRVSQFFFNHNQLLFRAMVACFVRTKRE